MKYRIAIFFLSASLSAAAWSAEGHRIIAAVAKSQLSADVVNVVNHYLHGMTWEDAACWMDQVQGERKYDYMKSWHYVPQTRDGSPPRAIGVNLTRQLETSINILKRRDLLSMDMVAENIKIVMHLVGDVHDPLNCGYVEDNYGSSAMVKLNGQTVSLRKVWDEMIMADNKIDVWSEIKYVFNLQDKGRKQLQKVEVPIWVSESRVLLDDVYDFKNNELPPDYLKKNGKLVERQIVLAGLRLAGIFNTLFGG